jgi:hypothetical protein
MPTYKGGTFFITQGEVLKLVGPNQAQEKDKWLQALAKDLFTEYVLSGKEVYKALKMQYDGKHVFSVNDKFEGIDPYKLYSCVTGMCERSRGVKFSPIWREPRAETRVSTGIDGVLGKKTNTP